jgi:hypothetical protein
MLSISFVWLAYTDEKSKFRSLAICGKSLLLLFCCWLLSSIVVRAAIKCYKKKTTSQSNLVRLLLCRSLVEGSVGQILIHHTLIKYLFHVAPTFLFTTTIPYTENRSFLITFAIVLVTTPNLGWKRES